MKFKREIKDDAKVAMLYAYRYLLNREPENMKWIVSNTKPWHELREEFIKSDEYVMMGEDNGLLSQDIFTTNNIIKAWHELSGEWLDYEKILERGYRKLIKKGDTVVDIGAHIGRHLAVFQELVGTGKLFAFEPLPKQFEYLKKTFNAPNITLYNFALFNTPGKSTFYELLDYPEESGLKLRIDKVDKNIKKETVNVEVHCLDEYEEQLKGLNYIKLDAEGAEVPILEGAERTLRRYRPFISTEYGGTSYGVYGLNASSLYEFCQKIDYIITDLWGNVILDLKMWEEIVNSCYWDYFLVPKERIREFWERLHKIK